MSRLRNVSTPELFARVERRMAEHEDYTHDGPEALAEIRRRIERLERGVAERTERARKERT